MRLLAALTIALWCIVLTKAATSPKHQSGPAPFLLALGATFALAIAQFA